MGLVEPLESGLDGLAQKIKNPFERDTRGRPLPDDFPKGFEIKEIGGSAAFQFRSEASKRIRLVGNEMPKVPFTFGGEQRSIRNYYPGHPEPTIQIFGPSEDDITINGLLKDRRLNSIDLYGAAEEKQKLIDSFRIRGNIIRIQMGEFQRFAILKSTKWDMKTRAEIGYAITFEIIGFNPPENCKILDRTGEIPFDINKNLIAAADDFRDEFSTLPEAVPASLGDLLNDAINEVAETVNSVTGFIDTITGAIEEVVFSANRAVGLIKNAKASLSRLNRTIGQISYDFDQISVGARYSVTGFTSNFISGVFDLQDFMAQLLTQFSFLARTVPAARVLTKEGDSLQKLALKHYGNADEWKLIYDHNKLSSTELSNATILEIPNL